MLDGYDAIDYCYELAGVCDRDPRLFSLRDLWLFYAGKSRFWRQHCLNQSYAIWGLDEEADPEAFVLMGAIRKRITENFAIPPDLQDEIRRKMEEAKLNNGYVIVDLPDLPKRQVTTPSPTTQPVPPNPVPRPPSGQPYRPPTPAHRRKQRF